jgi:predicted transcriptional regulator
MSKHLAVFTSPFIDFILKSKKTIESRFSKVRCAPFGAVDEGDVVLMKESGGLVLGEFTIAKVIAFENLDKNILRMIEQKYRKEICADIDKEFWKKKEKAHYATLLCISNPIRYENPFSFPKKDRRGWVVIK